MYYYSNFYKLLQYLLFLRIYLLLSLSLSLNVVNLFPLALLSDQFVLYLVQLCRQCGGSDKIDWLLAVVWILNGGLLALDHDS